MRHLVYIFCFLMLLTFNSSCSEVHTINRMINKFTKETITIPNDMECIMGQNVFIQEKLDLKPYKFIIYVDSLECSTCRIVKLADLKPLYELSEQYDFSIFNIFSPFEDYIELTKLQIVLENMDFPIYIDINKSFSKQNQCIPTDNRFHYFLLDSFNNPVYVGNPLNSESLMKLFIEILTQY